MKEYESSALIGEIDLKENAGLCEIRICYEPNQCPHMHIISKESNFESCICIFDKKYYFGHGVSDKLSDNQLQLFIEFMNSKGFILSNWKELWLVWNCKNGDKYCPKCGKRSNIPNYNLLNKER